jgi:nicotinamide-nucleotide amidase
MNKEKISATIITIGDELLIGQVVDTNSAWIAQELNKIGLAVKQRWSVGDVREAIWQALDEAAKSSQIVLMTGGLGPTADDITKPLLCEYFGGKMVFDEKALAHVKYISEKVLKRPLLERNMKQAEVPDVCEVLHNSRGSAPGMLFKKNDCVFVSMPGVPHEMKGIMMEHVLPRIQQDFDLPTILHKTLVLFGIGESFVAERLVDFEAGLPTHIKLAYLPNYNLLRLRLSGTAKDAVALTTEMETHFAALQVLMKDHLVIDKDQNMQQIVFDLLQSQQKTMATAESCTGGYIAHLITSIAGSSQIYNGSVVAYAYDMKEDSLGVSHESLLTFGAVSEEVVRQMHKGLLATSKADYGIATTGIMGPGGATEDKPVGTVWVAVGDAQQVVAKKFHFRFDRLKNIELTAMNALNLLRELMVSNHSTKP